MLEGNEIKVIRKNNWQTKIDRIRSQQIREFCCIRPIIGLVERRRREWDGYVKNKDAERLVKISRDNIPDV